MSLTVQIHKNVMSDEQFFEFCQMNRDLKIERNKNGKVLIMAPTGSFTGNYNVELSSDLVFWNRRHKKGKVLVIII